MSVLQSSINDQIGDKALNLVENGDYVGALDMIRNQTNPLIAAWLAVFLFDNVSEHNLQFKNWLANATYNGV